MDVFYRESQLGYYGEIADDFSVIIRALWSGQYKCITPRDFKVLKNPLPTLRSYNFIIPDE